MGKLSQQRRSRLRMTQYNITKSREEYKLKDDKIQILENEISNIKIENEEILSNALHAQKQLLNEKHKVILHSYSEKLKQIYKKKF